MQGIGKPELLKHDKSGLYSRRIDEANRLVYVLMKHRISELYHVRGIMKIKNGKLSKGGFLFCAFLRTFGKIKIAVDK